MTQRLKQIAESKLGRYLSYNDSDRRGDEATGKKDALKGIPSLKDTHCQFTAQEITQASAALHGYDVARRAYLAERQSARDALVHERDEQFAERRAALIDEKSNRLTQLSKTFGPEGAKMRAADEAAKSAEASSRRLEAELARPLRVSMLWAYPVVMTLVAIAEVPVNRMAFELFFQETPALSLGISLLVGGILAFFAHLVGLWMKQANGHRTVGKRLGHYAGVLFILGLTLPLIYLIAALRQHFIALLEADKASSFSDLLRQGTESVSGLASTTAQIAKVDMGTAGWTLFTINIVIFAVGVLVSFIRHDPHPDYEKVVRAARKTKKAHHKLLLAYETKLKAVTEECDEKIAAVDRQADSVAKDITAYEADIAAAERHLGENIKAVTLNVASRIASYQKGNRAARTDGTPACFGPVDEAVIRNLITRNLGDESLASGPARVDNVVRFHGE